MRSVAASRSQAKNLVSNIKLFLNYFLCINNYWNLICIFEADKFWKELAQAIGFLRAPSASPTAARDPAGATRELLVSSRRVLEALMEKLLAGYVLLKRATLHTATSRTTPSGTDTPKQTPSQTPKQTPKQTPSKRHTSAASGSSPGANLKETTLKETTVKKKEKDEAVEIEGGVGPKRALDLAAGVYTVSVALACLIRELEASWSAGEGGGAFVSTSTTASAYQSLLAFFACFFDRLREAAASAPNRHVLLERLFSTLDEHVKTFTRIAIKCMSDAFSQCPRKCCVNNELLMERTALMLLRDCCQRCF